MYTKLTYTPSIAHAKTGFSSCLAFEASAIPSSESD